MGDPLDAHSPGAEAMTEAELIEAMAVAIWNLEHVGGPDEWERAPGEGPTR